MNKLERFNYTVDKIGDEAMLEKSEDIGDMIIHKELSLVQALYALTKEVETLKQRLAELEK